MRIPAALLLTACFPFCAQASEPAPLGNDIPALLRELKEKNAREGKGAEVAGRPVAKALAADWSKMPSNSFTIADYPALGSAESDEEYRILHEWQDQRSESDCRLARSQKIPAFKYLFRAGVSPLTAAEVSEMQPLMDQVFKLGTRVAGHYKHQYSRPRPFETDPTLTPCAHKPGGRTSYPSSHALVSYLGACVLSAKYEDRADALVDYGVRLGDLRAIVGVHHPSDVRAGQDLAYQICGRLLEDNDFLDRLR